jgi:hypothetical protein
MTCKGIRIDNPRFYKYYPIMETIEWLVKNNIPLENVRRMDTCGYSITVTWKENENTQDTKI